MNLIPNNMGCNVSRIDSNAIVLPPRLRPLFLQRLNEIKSRRNGIIVPLKDPTHSKKELLHDNKYEDDNVSSYNPSPNVSKRIVFSQEANEKEIEKRGDENPNKHEAVKEERSRGKGTENDTKNDSNDTENEITDTDYDDEDDERMIGHEDDESFPGSPSFRVYFTDDGEDGHNDIGKHVAFKETASSDDGLSSKESSKNKKVKKARKKRSFRLPKGGQNAMKNLLNVKSCYTSHSHTRLLSEKTPT